MPPATKPLPLAFQTTYAELLEQCSLDAFNEAFPEAGTFVSKDVAGKRYWYFQLPASEGQKQKYVGAESPQLLEHIKRHQQAREAERTRRSLVSTLVRSAALPRPIPRIGEIVAALAKAGVFRLHGVLVGTVAYQTYPAILGMRLPATSLSTNDVDIAQFTYLSVAVKDTTAPMLDVLKAVDESFRAVPHVHDGRRSVTYRAADGVRVDFLTPNEGPDSDKPRRLPALGTDAEPLRFLDFLIRSPEPAVVLHGAGIYVMVPAPERYAVHKLIVAQRRVGPGNIKRPKDLVQSEALLNRLVEAKPNELRDVWHEAESRSARWLDYMLTGLADINPTVRDRTLAVVGKTRADVPELDLRFEDSAPRDDFEREAVMLWASAGKQRIRCIVSRTVLEDHYGAEGLGKEGRIKKLQDNRQEIEALIREKYLHDPVEESGTIVLKTLEIERLRAKIAAKKPRRVAKRK
ncbi:MAG: GSU2403 family nucleotidyltransferase fold protein [Reyranella sp.]